MTKSFVIPKDHSFNLDFLQSNNLNLTEFLDQLECALVAESVQKTFDNKKNETNLTSAAKLLGINRTTLMMKVYKLRAYGIVLEKKKIVSNAKDTQEA